MVVTSTYGKLVYYSTQIDEMPMNGGNFFEILILWLTNLSC